MRQIGRLMIFCCLSVIISCAGEPSESSDQATASPGQTEPSAETTGQKMPQALKGDWYLIDQQDIYWHLKIASDRFELNKANSSFATISSIGNFILEDAYVDANRISLVCKNLDSARYQVLHFPSVADEKLEMIWDQKLFFANVEGAIQQQKVGLNNKYALTFFTEDALQRFKQLKPFDQVTEDEFIKVIQDMERTNTENRVKYLATNSDKRLFPMYSRQALNASLIANGFNPTTAAQTLSDTYRKMNEVPRVRRVVKAYGKSGK